MRTYKTHHLIYAVLLFVAIVIILNVYSLQADENIRMLAINIGTGIISSVVVAWLIDIMNSTMKNVELSNKNADMFRMMWINVTFFLYQFPEMVKIISPNNKYLTEKKTWEEWVEVLTDLIDDDLSPNNVSFIKSHIHSHLLILNKQIEDILNNKVLLMAGGYIDFKMFNYILAIKDTLFGIETLMDTSKNNSELRKVIGLFATDLRENIEKIQEIRKVNKVKFSLADGLIKFSAKALI